MSTFYILLALLFLLLILLYRKNIKKLHLPPGPLCIPIVGYLLQINPKSPHVTLTNLSRKYGPICGLKMGSIYTVLLSDPRLIRQALAKDVFSGRAPLYLTHGIMEGYGLICAEGDLWREQRRFVTNSLKNLGMVKFGPKKEKLEERILIAVNECITKIRERSTKDGFEPLDILHHCLGNLINSLVFGKTYEEDDKIWKWLRHLQEEGVKHIGVAGPLNFLPFLRFIPRYGNTMATLIDGKVKTHKVYRAIIEEHRKKIQTNSPDADPMTESFLAAFDQEMTSRQKADNVGHFTESQFYHLLADLFGAGVDTTLTTLRWLLLFMAAHPEEQGKVYEEMVQVLGRKNKPRLIDRDALIRLEAAISEVQRIRSVTPVGIPHGTTEDTKIGEYDVPKNTMVVPLQWAIHTDPNYWDNPFEFKTDRFIADDGSLLKPEAFLPFQCGKRMCIGDELARMILFLFAGRILYAFKISLAPGETLDLEGECGITLIPKPHRLLFEQR